MEQRGRAGYSEMGKSGSREGSAQTYRRNAARRRFPTLPDLLFQPEQQLLAGAFLRLRQTAVQLRRAAMLTLIPVSLAQANEFVRQHHRHHKPVAGHKFSIGCAENGRLCAVAIVGRPVSRYLDDGFTLEVNRLCSDGTKNACSILYAAAARAARAMGYRKIITYTLDTESGASLRAAGWTNAGLAGGKAWTGSRRPAQPLYPAQMKYRYEKRLNERSC